MLVHIYDRTPGNHTKIGEAKMNSIPREGEHVVLDDKSKVVHSVTWDLTEMSVTLLLR
jgi:hypothetical protein